MSFNDLDESPDDFLNSKLDKATCHAFQVPGIKTNIKKDPIN